MATQPTWTPIGASMTLRQKLTLMGVLMVTMFITVLDSTIVTTAAPRIVAELGGFALLSWVFTVFLLASTVTIPIVGKLSDMFGRKQFLLTGIAIFVGASMLCGAAPTMLTLIIARGIQGVGAGLLISCVFATLGDIFTPIERAKYFAILGGMFTFAQLLGPAVGGVLTDGPGWRWCFYINLPIGALAAFLIGTRLPAGGGSGGTWRGIDFLGATLLAIGTAAFMLGANWSSERYGWGSAPTLGLLGGSLVLAIAFVAQESRHPEAIMPLSLLRNRAWVQAVGIVVLTAGAIGAATQYLPAFVQTSLGQSATASGFVIVPQALGGFVTTVLSGQIVARTGRYKPVVIIGAIGALISCLLLRGLNTETSPLWLAAMMVLLGLSTGVVFPISQVVAQASVSQFQQGTAASSRQFFLQLSNVFGIGLLGLLLTTSYASNFTDRTADIAHAIEPAIYEQFKDPTLALDAARYEHVRTELRGVPGGDALLASALTNQREAVAHAIDMIFTVSTVSAVALLAVALTLKTIPLRNSFSSDAEETTPSLEPV